MRQPKGLAVAPGPGEFVPDVRKVRIRLSAADYETSCRLCVQEAAPYTSEGRTELALALRLRPGENQGAPAPVGTAEIRPSLPHAQPQPSPETRQIPLNKFSKKPKKRLAFFVDLCYDIRASGR